MHKKLVLIVRVVLEIFSQTDMHTEAHTYTWTYSSQYFADTPAGDVKISL